MSIICEIDQILGNNKDYFILKNKEFKENYQVFSIANVVSYLLSIFPLTIYTLNSLMYKQSFVIVYTV